MNLQPAWDALESDLHPTPEFHVEGPDGRKDWPEAKRQATFLRLMRMCGPRVLVYANANAGKRNPAQARREGIMAGVFDLTCVWREKVCWLEMKGYSKAGRPGVLSDAQIEFGNRVTQLGWPAACFFDPQAALSWLVGQGFPVREPVT